MLFHQQQVKEVDATLDRLAGQGCVDPVLGHWFYVHERVGMLGEVDKAGVAGRSELEVQRVGFLGLMVAEDGLAGVGQG